MQALVVHLGVHLSAAGGRALLVVLDAGGEIVATLHAGVADRADAGLGELESRVVLQLLRSRAEALDEFQLGGVDAVHDLLALRELLVGEHDDGGLELLGDVKRLDGDFKSVGHAHRGEDGANRVAMRREGRGKEVGLLTLGGHARGRATALDVDTDQRELGDAGQAEGFGLEGEAGAGGGRHGFGATERGADRGGDASDLVFGLEDGAAVLPDLLLEILHDFRGVIG